MTYSIVPKSRLEGAKRLDAEYYQPEYLAVENKLNFIKTNTIGEIADSVVNFGAYSLCNYIQWQEKGVPYLNVQDIKDGYIDFSDTKFIDEKVNEVLKKSQVREGQVILTMAGTIGNAAIAYKIPPKVNSNQATAKITFKKEFSPYYFTAFLNCYYGRKQTEREIVSSVQPNIFLFQIKNFKVPIVSKLERDEIEKIFKLGLDELGNSESFYQQAENLLLEELKIKDLNLADESGFIVNLSEVKENNRCDAEYFQPKYKKLAEYIKKNCNGILLGDLITMKKGVEPGAEEYQDEGKQFIRVSSLSKQGVSDSGQKYLSDDLYKKLKDDYEPKKGEILLTKDASPGIAYVLKENVEGIISSGVLRMKAKKDDVESEYLALCLNSIIGRMQAERDAGGSVIAHWKPEQIKNIIIPLLSKSSQQKISDLICQSFEARKKAKELLEEAKRKVEEMIERGGVDND
jgi:restriction endonuclease S subunit